MINGAPYANNHPAFLALLEKIFRELAEAMPADSITHNNSPIINRLFFINVLFSRTCLHPFSSLLHFRGFPFHSRGLFFPRAGVLVSTGPTKLLPAYSATE